ncbi:TPA: Solitary outer membrane autotransporter beta-barrel domain [Vibrio vulnificus]|nr:Solitary outer membrane autotransporter beta-barrel domain [Vibrio vulnificus]
MLRFPFAVSTSVFAIILLPSFALSAQELNDLIQKELERNFATAIVLTDSDVFTVGFHDFDPNEWLNLDNEELGSADSVNLRKKIGVSTLPFEFALHEDPDSQIKHSLQGRLSALGIEQDVSIADTSVSDSHREYVLGAFLEYTNSRQLSENWTFDASIGAHLMYYRSDYTYRGDALADYKSVIDGYLVNTDAWALVAEPNVQAKYLQMKPWGKWYYWSSAHYFYGQGRGEANRGQVGNPEGWYWVNGVKMFYDFEKWGRAVQSVYTSFNRVDVGGDTSESLGTRHYYEASVGWLMTPPFKTQWVDNVGIGLSLNYGSALKGGSLVLFFNQD